MKKYYSVRSYPFFTVIGSKWSEIEHATFEEAHAEAEAITNENPLIKTEVWYMEDENGILKTSLKEVICRVEMG